MKPIVAIGQLGPTLDRGVTARRWDAWRASVALVSHEDLVFDRFVLLFQPKFAKIAEQIRCDIKRVSPETTVQPINIEFADPWDFEEVYGALLDFANDYPFDPEREEYFVHMTTGTHVARICLYLLTEARYIPAQLIQTIPPPKSRSTEPGTYNIINLDLSKYDTIAARFSRLTASDTEFLKAGIETRNPDFNCLINEIEKVSVLSKAPMLLTGETGVGKSQLARRIYELKKRRRKVGGLLVEVNCATIRGDGAMSALFGHRKGAFTGALADRDGLLKSADGGVLFLDEIGELGLDEQAMLLRAIEQKTFLPVGSDREAESNFQLIAGTNRDLRRRVSLGTFREDLLARIHLWTFEIPPLRARREDLLPNLEYEIEFLQWQLGHKVHFNQEAREFFMGFAERAEWPGNFRDFHASLERMATLSGGNRISIAEVLSEIERLKRSWVSGANTESALLTGLLSSDEIASLDRFDRAQLEEVVRVCSQASSLSEAGRTLFASSMARRKSSNDSDRLRKYLQRFGIDPSTAMRVGQK